MKNLFHILFVILLASCVGNARHNEIVLSGGIGGTGITTWEGGIGGTGVVGTVTGFGSIVVNGMHIHYSQDQVVHTPTGNMLGQDFAIGQVVAAETVFANGRLQATKLSLQVPLSGPVEAINTQQNTIRVLGETVKLLDNIAMGTQSIATIKHGQSVTVSGYRGPDGVYASRIDIAQTTSVPVISGTVTNVGNRTVEVDRRHQLSLPNGQNRTFAVGDYISLTGLRPTTGGQYQAQNVMRHYGPMFDGAAVRMSVEGIFSNSLPGIPGIGALKGIPEGRGVVFVTRSLDGALTLNGVAARPGNRWNEPLHIRAQGMPNKNQKDPNLTPSDRSSQGRDRSGSGGNSGGGGSSGGGGGGNGGGGNGGR